MPMSSPRVLVVSWYSPLGAVVQRVLGGAHVVVPRPDRVLARRVSANAVIVDVPDGASDVLRARVKAWTIALVEAGTSTLVLCEPGQMLWPDEATEKPSAATRPTDGSARALQLVKPVRGPELRGLVSWTLGVSVKRAAALDGPSEELLLSGLRIGQLLGLPAREMELVVRALELRDRDEIAARMEVTRSQVDFLASELKRRTKTSLEAVVRQAWLQWVTAVADDEGSGAFSARVRKGSGMVVQGVVGPRQQGG
jgi:hypothetical protein